MVNISFFSSNGEWQETWQMTITSYAYCLTKIRNHADQNNYKYKVICQGVKL